MTLLRLDSVLRVTYDLDTKDHFFSEVGKHEAKVDETSQVYPRASLKFSSNSRECEGSFLKLIMV